MNKPSARATAAHNHSHVITESRRKYRRPDLYFNRETALVDFSRRVLEEAQSDRHPLLERVKFLAFVSSQLDEFLMVRLAGLYDQVDAQVNEVGPDGLLPSQQLNAVRPQVQTLLRDQLQCLRTDLMPRLSQAGIEVLNYADLTRAQREAADEYFREGVLPVLTPLGVDPGHPFPHISNRSLNLAVTLQDPEAGELFARVKVPATLRRLVEIPPTSRGQRANEHGSHRHYAFVWLEQLISAHLDMLFPGITVVSSYPFRVLRNADIEVSSDEAGDLLATVELGLRQRRFGFAVNMATPPEMPLKVRQILQDNMELDAEAVWEIPSPLGLSDLSELTDLDRPDLKDPPLVPRMPVELRHGQDVFAAVRRHDLLLHHPYDAFSSVADFISAAARDPNVLAIKQTLYRVGHNSPIVAALLEASAHGKQVAVLVELKARFDEENNIEWARTLERAGVHVVYGQINLKTHAKVALVVRREAGGLQRYVHLGTGNYNASTARVYEDYALLTSRDDIGADVTNLFNALTGYARGITYEKLLVAPGSMRTELMRRIDREVERHRADGAGRIIFKCNALVDPPLIRALYRASHAGVKIDLIVRGICALRPGIPGVSENIRVVSLVGRFLEHSRIYYFRNGGGGKEEVYLGSADLMPRNLDNRVEVLFPLEDAVLRAQLVEDVLPAYFRDTANARVLLPDGGYLRLAPAKGEQAFDIQQFLAQDGAVQPETDPAFAIHASETPESLTI